MALTRPSWPLLPGNVFASGINYPWSKAGGSDHYGWDFGIAPWGAGAGVSANATAVGNELLPVSQNQLKVVRWFVLADCRSGLTWSDKTLNATPTGLDGQVVADLQAALTIAQSGNFQLDLVLFDFLLCGTAGPDSTNTYQLFGRQGLMSDPGKSQALWDKVVTPLVTACAPFSQQIFSWEIMNEPDWVATPNKFTYGQDSKKVDLKTTMPNFTLQMVSDWLQAGAAAIHKADSSAQVTAGFARLSSLKQALTANTMTDLNFLQIHYYPNMAGSDNDVWDPIKFSWDPTIISVPPDRPIVVGEFCLPAGTASYKDAVKHFYSIGAAGAWPWSLNKPAADAGLKCAAPISPDLSQLQAADTEIKAALAATAGGAKNWLINFTSTDPTSNIGDGRPWGDGTAVAARAKAKPARDPWDTNCKAEPIIGGFEAMAAMRNVLIDAIAKATAAGKPGDDLGHVYIADWRLNPLRDMSTDNTWSSKTGWSKGDAADSDETLAGLILRLMQAGILVRIIAWLPTKWEQKIIADAHVEEHFWLADLIAAESARLRGKFPSLAGKPPIGLIALDARVGPGNEAGAHHQKFMVVRVPGLDVAFVGGVDLAFTRRDAPDPTKGFDITGPPAFHVGDWQSGTGMPNIKDGWPHDKTTDYSTLSGIANPSHATPTDLAPVVYGNSLQRWHDQHIRLEGRIVQSVEEHFGERWLRSGPAFLASSKRKAWDWGDVLLSEWTGKPSDPITPVPIGPDIATQPGQSTVQLWRTIPLPKVSATTAPLQRGEFTVLAGVVNAIKQADNLIWIFDQYFWSLAYARLVNKQLIAKPNLSVVLILPPYADDGTPRIHGVRHRTLSTMVASIPNRSKRVGIYDLWDTSSHQGIYCHAKSVTYDSDLLVVGSANVNRRSFLGDSEIACAVADRDVVGTHQNRLWTLLFANTKTPAFPSIDLSQAGSGLTFFAAFDAAAKDTKSYLIVDPWELTPPVLPGPTGPIPRPEDMPYDLTYDRMDYRCVKATVESGNADLELIYQRLETKPGSGKAGWPYRQPDT